eukprot:8939885-Heterocapsa_arctica.AAC.1
MREGSWLEVEDKQALNAQGQIYLDGSFIPHLLQGFGRAGWGLVKVGPEGEPLARAFGPV